MTAGGSKGAWLDSEPFSSSYSTYSPHTHVQFVRSVVLSFHTCSLPSAQTNDETLLLLGDSTVLTTGGRNEEKNVTLTSATLIDTVSLFNTGSDGWCSSSASDEWPFGLIHIGVVKIVDDLHWGSSPAASDQLLMMMIAAGLL